MKKTIVILSVMILLFTVACSKQIVEEPSTTSGFDTYTNSTKAETDLTQKSKTDVFGKYNFIDYSTYCNFNK